MHMPYKTKSRKKKKYQNFSYGYYSYKNELIVGKATKISIQHFPD